MPSRQNKNIPTTTDNYSIIKETYLKLTDTLFEDILRNHHDCSETVSYELSKLKNAHHLLISNLDDFKEYSESLEKSSSAYYQEVIDDILENSTDAIRAINRQIIRSPTSQSPDFSSMQYNRMIDLVTDHLKYWQWTLDDLHEELPITNYKTVNIDNLLMPSTTPQAVTSAENNSANIDSQYSDLKNNYTALQKEVLEIIEDKYALFASADSKKNPLTNINKYLETIETFHEKLSTPWGQLLITERNQHENIMFNSIEQITAIKNKLYSAEPSYDDFKSIMKLISEHEDYLNSAVKSMYTDTLKSAATFQDRRTVGGGTIAPYSKH